MGRKNYVCVAIPCKSVRVGDIIDKWAKGINNYSQYIKTNDQ